MLQDFMNLFKSIYISLGIMQISYRRNWQNLGVILETCGGINDHIGVLLIRDLFVTESTTLSNSPL